ncbi:hypothetical protein [Endozoicomonas sp. SCSIO W0465]|uniref:hypothetical protein n=1 Tax=Endozoicomonas sp. SCSIO W0465 TaxID=2918516 RepID=UPI00207608CC|nr:hypothetical protein [Endozoicomonas sp. SCSIO W0465]USE39536.1 hypothetical protein MJO57_16040 [Endozoicomonas sp. SCSIO W0465]
MRKVDIFKELGTDAMLLENILFNAAGKINPEYNGGQWEYYIENENDESGLIAIYQGEKDRIVVANDTWGREYTISNYQFSRCATMFALSHLCGFYYEKGKQASGSALEHYQRLNELFHDYYHFHRARATESELAIID